MGQGGGVEAAEWVLNDPFADLAQQPRAEDLAGRCVERDQAQSFRFFRQGEELALQRQRRPQEVGALQVF